MKIEKTGFRNSLLSIVVALFLLQSCSNNTVHNMYQPIEGATWNKNVEYFFTFEIEDASLPYNVVFEVRNNDFYSFRNLWVFYSEESPVADLRRDTVELSLANEYGRWTGKGFSLYESEFALLKDYYFPVRGQYTFSFRHGMRSDVLYGIHDIGLRIEKKAIPIVDFRFLHH